MSYIIYKDEKSGKGFFMPDVDPTQMFLSHFKNYMYLSFILQNSNNFSEKHQANKELKICERKMEFWKRHGDFNFEHALNKMLKEKGNWKTSVKADYVLKRK